MEVARLLLQIAIGIFASAITGAPLGSQTIELGDTLAMLDQVVPIRVHGLEPGQIATLIARNSDLSHRNWSASATFQADAHGSIDVGRQAPLRGTYTGIAPMGLFQSMVPVAGFDSASARFVSDWWFEMTTEIALQVDRVTVVTDTLRRVFAAPGVRVTPIRRDGLVGVRFSPPASKAIHGHVLVLGGSEGGLGSADVASLLASHGFDALALAYFGSDSLPAQLAEIPLEYFGHALELLHGADSTVPKLPVAILGTSKGAEAALLVAARYPIVNGVVAYAPSSMTWSCICDSTTKSSWTWAGQAVPAVPPGADPAYHPPAGAPLTPAKNYAYRRSINPIREAVIPVEKTSAKILLIAGDSDALWPSAPMAEEIRRARAGRGEGLSTEVLVYKNAGHLIGKAYLPGGSTLIARGRVETGGTPQSNAKAQADSWPKVLEFLSSL
jgi:dienelactone hydrolase